MRMAWVNVYLPDELARGAVPTRPIDRLRVQP